MAIPAVPSNTTPADFKTWVLAVKADIEALQAAVAALQPPVGATMVYATADTAVADANPDDHFLITN